MQNGRRRRRSAQRALSHLTPPHPRPRPQALAWLACKVAQAQRALGQQLSGLEPSAQAAYAVAFLSEYLPDKWCVRARVCVCACVWWG